MPATFLLLSEHDRENAEEWPTTPQGRTLLHLAASRQHPLMELLEGFVQRRAHLLRHADQDDILPVHDAAQSHVPLETLQCVVERDPHAFDPANRAGSLPRHVGLNQASPPMDKVRYLVAQHRPTLDVADLDGSLPLHAALAHGRAYLELVEFLVDQRLPSLRHTNRKGLMPLHVAASSDASLDVLYYVASKFPEAIGKERASNGRVVRPLQRLRLVR
jgi:hypothetical protein